MQLFLGNPGDYAWGREGLDAIVTQLLNQMDSTGRCDDESFAGINFVTNGVTLRRSPSSVEGRHRCAARSRGDGRTGEGQVAVFGVLGGFPVQGERPPVALPPHLPRAVHQALAGAARHLPYLQAEPRERGAVG